MIYRIEEHNSDSYEWKSIKIKGKGNWEIIEKGSKLKLFFPKISINTGEGLNSRPNEIKKQKLEEINTEKIFTFEEIFSDKWYRW